MYQSCYSVFIINLVLKATLFNVLLCTTWNEIEQLFVYYWRVSWSELFGFNFLHFKLPKSQNRLRMRKTTLTDTSVIMLSELVLEGSYIPKKLNESTTTFAVARVHFCQANKKWGEMQDRWKDECLTVLC